ncbi:MAG: hypothetical protein K2P98_02675 [Neisseriaceae bacterium]|nr:hypothetical protein [Neisseriaceae bacterium]
MTPYAINSPEALARLITLFMLADGEISDNELDTLEKLDVFTLIGLDRKSFTQVFKTYFDDISAEMENDGFVHLVDIARFNTLLNEVTDHNKRLLLCILALDLTKSDHDINETEMTLLRHMMNRWHISLDQVKASVKAI